MGAAPPARQPWRGSAPPQHPAARAGGSEHGIYLPYICRICPPPGSGTVALFWVASTAPLTQVSSPCVGIMAKAGSSGISVMRVDLDAATTTSADAHEAQWRSGVNRQAQPHAASHQKAASQAAAAKRKANAMVGEEKAAADRCRADRRNAAKRVKRAGRADVRG